MGVPLPKKIYAGYQLDFTDLDDPDIPIDNGLFVPGNPPLNREYIFSFSLPEGFTRGTQEESGTNGNSSLQALLSPCSQPVGCGSYVAGRMGTVSCAEAFSHRKRLTSKKRGAGYNNAGSSSWPYPQHPGSSLPLSGQKLCPFPRQSMSLRIRNGLPLTAVSPVNPFFSAYYPLPECI